MYPKGFKYDIVNCRSGDFISYLAVLNEVDPIKGRHQRSPCLRRAVYANNASV